MTAMPFPTSMGLEFQDAIADFPMTLADRIKSRARRVCAIETAGPKTPEVRPSKKRKAEDVALPDVKPKVASVPVSPAPVPLAPASLASMPLASVPLASIMLAPVTPAPIDERVATSPDANAPDIRTLDANAPDVKTPDANAPDANAPDANAPDANVLNAKTPNANVPDAKTPDARTPDARTPDANILDANTLDTKTPEANTPCVVAGADENFDDFLTRDLRLIDEDVICVASKVANGTLESVERPRTDQEYVAAMQEVLARWSAAKTSDAQRRSSRRIKMLLDLATPPQPSEAYFASAEEAELLVSPDSFVNCPIFTKEQQPTPLQSTDQFLSEFYDDDALVDVQDPSMPVAPHTRRIAIGKVKERFRSDRPSNKPWNLLEIATHVDEGIRPAFLNGEDCRLLTKLKIPLGEKNLGARRPYDTGYKEMERWALLAQAGALTEPHQDSHGYSTFITCNQGEIGFGWLSNPTDAERAAWRASPFTFVGGRWRYAVLRPGDTVYFPAGTVHFVFRLPVVGNTLAFGGHVLRCSNIVHWAKTLLEERQSSNITNEELSSCAFGSLERVETFVTQALRKGREARWGGKGSIEEFLKLKQRFVAM